MLGMPWGRRLTATLLTAVVVTGMLTVGPSAAHAQEPAFTVADSLVREPTGMARDTTLRGRDNPAFWLTERRGPGRLVAVDAGGQSLGQTGFGAQTIDVQALAKADDRLYIGDIGDESGSRKKITVYRITNPRPEGKQNYRAYDFRYPDGAKDARAMYIRNGRIHVVTRGDRPGIYQAPEQPRRDGVNDLQRIADAPPNITDAVALTDGRVALRSHDAMVVLDSSGTVLAQGPTPMQPAGESMARGDGGEILL